MRESISYAFLLNIVITFVFTCFAIIMGIFSYYKAFRANSIISETIEKYEGYNCLSKEEIARKLDGIGYNTPFNVTCNSKDGNCDDSGKSYKIISYNLDFKGDLVYKNDPMSSSYICETINKNIDNENGKLELKKNNCTTNKHYQYGIYTYMYVELPVVSGLIKMPFFAKTSTMYEFRNFHIEFVEENDETIKRITDTDQMFESMYERIYKDGKLYVTDAYYGNPINVTGDIEYNTRAIEILANDTKKAYAAESTGKTYSFMSSTKDGNNLRDNYIYEMLKQRANGKIDALVSSNIKRSGLNGESYMRKCGFIMDYSKIN